jgi:3-deoxy-D-manno-octulosonic-acid transferase
MLTGYRIFAYLALPWVLVRLAIRSFRSPAYRSRIAERFGLAGPSPEPGGVWIHAVSVGEVNAAIPLVRRILDRWPELAVTVTTMTPTGSDRVQGVLGAQVSHCYLPYDYPGAVARFLGRVRPSIGLVMETEIWPNLVHHCHRSGTPLVYTNVRLSERSWRGYRRFRSLVSRTLRRISVFAVQSEPDARRLVDLGAPVERVHVTGSLKFDMAMPPSVMEAGEAIRRRLGWNRPLLLAASTHEGEEEIVLRVFRELRGRMGELLLVLVPRHPERFAPVERLCRREGFNLRMASTQKDILADEVEVLVVDSMGELPKYIAACDVVFMAGSMVPVGGHNLLEAAALGRPVVFGPHMFNFAEISAMFLSQGAGIQVDDEDELAAVLLRLLEDAGMRDEYGIQGRRLVEQNRGALDKVEELVDCEMNHGMPVRGSL